MATITPKRLISGSQLTTSVATYYTVPANTKAVIRNLSISNTTATAQTATLYLVPSGGTAGATNQLVTTHTVPAHSEWQCSIASGHVLEAGGTIQGLADAATALTIMGSGIVYE